MNTLQTKFAVGDVVYHASTNLVIKQHKCPDCKDKREWATISPAGGSYTFACPRCTAAYISSRETSLSYHEHESVVERLTIGSIRLDTADSQGSVSYMCEETGVGGGRVYRENHLFRTMATAMDAAEQIASQYNASNKQIVEHYSQTLSVSDYQLDSALIREASIARSAAGSLLFNLECLFENIETAADKGDILELIAEYKERQLESDRRKFNELAPNSISAGDS